MPKFVSGYECERCFKTYSTISEALDCEASDQEHREDMLRKKNEEEGPWLKQGHDIWYEYSGMQHAPTVDTEKFGSHDFPNEHGTSDCSYACGCWMGPARSGGKTSPHGACPNNPKGNEVTDGG
ncbi:MAG: hypothetical protein IH951_11640 [Bacteroidetes bacterium]|nr:hypothetical protein [Bacteroidota bacterium]